VKEPAVRPLMYVCMYVCREIEWDGIDWIDLAQDMDQWRSLVNTPMNLQFP
jgi:hypothetical protein